MAEIVVTDEAVEAGLAAINGRWPVAITAGDVHAALEAAAPLLQVRLGREEIEGAVREALDNNQVTGITTTAPGPDIPGLETVIGDITGYVRSAVLALLSPEETKCPGCGGEITPRYADKGVCGDCYGTTDDPALSTSGEVKP